MKRVAAQYDASRLIADRPIRVAMQDGLHVRVVQRISAEEARALIAELEAALALSIENHENRAHENCPAHAGGST